MDELFKAALETINFYGDPSKASFAVKTTTVLDALAAEWGDPSLLDVIRDWLTAAEEPDQQAEDEQIFQHDVSQELDRLSRR